MHQEVSLPLVMSTPENNRLRPINKSLLTPCRRPGLSRKVKTPLHIVNNEVNNSSVETKPTNPISRENVVREADKLPRTGQKRKRISSTDETSLQLKFYTDDDSGHQLNKPSYNNKSPAYFKQEDELAQVKSPYVPEIKNRVDTDTCIKPEALDHKEFKLKKSFKRLSMKRSMSSIETSNFEDYQKTLQSKTIESNLKLQVLSESQSTHSNKEISSDMILELKQRIKAKKEKLEMLKQAAIYKKLHDVNDLQNLIDIWKNGCKRAFNELYLKLQTHATISKEHLIQKFNIPEEILDVTNL